MIEKKKKKVKTSESCRLKSCRNFKLGKRDTLQVTRLLVKASKFFDYPS